MSGVYFLVWFTIILPKFNLAGNCVGINKNIDFKRSGTFLRASLEDSLHDQRQFELNLHLPDTTKWPWPDNLDAVRAAPNSHKVLFENDNVRILEVTVDPYGFEPMHTHRYSSIMFGPSNDSSRYDIIYYRYDYDSLKHTYFAKDSSLQHGGNQTGGSAKGHFMSPEGPHRIRNLSNVRIVAFRVEFKTPLKE